MEERSDLINKIENQENQNKEVIQIENNVVTDLELKKLVAYLIGYSISSISHSKEQWIEWGIPYLEICLESLQLTDKTLLNDINNTFINSIGKDFLFTSEIVEEDWNYIDPTHRYIDQLLLKLQQYQEEEIIQLFLNVFFQSIQRINYDARFKIVSHRILSMFSVYEEIIPPTPSSSSSSSTSIETNSMKQTSLILSSISKTHSSSELFRIWKIGIAATIGGALMFCVGKSLFFFLFFHTLFHSFIHSFVCLFII